MAEYVRLDPQSMYEKAQGPELAAEITRMSALLGDVLMGFHSRLTALEATVAPSEPVDDSAVGYWVDRAVRAETQCQLLS